MGSTLENDMNDLDRLFPGTFIKTRGARDRVGLRKIVEVKKWSRGTVLLVDHFSWAMKKETLPDGSVVKKYSVVRQPYSSEVGADKVIRIYHLDKEGFLVKIDKVKIGR